MKALVKETFNDKHTGELHKVGDILEITDERFAEILTVAPLVEAIPEDAGDAAGDAAGDEAPVEDAAPEAGEAETETKTKKGRK